MLIVHTCACVCVCVSVCVCVCVYRSTLFCYQQDNTLSPNSSVHMTQPATSLGHTLLLTDLLRPLVGGGGTAILTLPQVGWSVSLTRHGSKVKVRKTHYEFKGYSPHPRAHVRCVHPNMSLITHTNCVFCTGVS